MANGFKVTTERLDEASAFITEKTTQYNSDIAKLYSELEAMTANQWKGIASETFQSKIESYRGEFDLLKKALDSFAEILLQKSKNYVNTENTITNNANSL